MKVEFFKHSLDEHDISSCCEALKSTFLSTGPKVAEFEEKFAEYLGVKYVVGVNSCTSALFLALKTCGIGTGDEVITTDRKSVV